MGLYEKLPDDIEEVDVIIAGGGTAGCVIAARLADADPSLSILVIERGPNNRDVPNIIHPVLVLSHMIPTSKTTIFYQAKKEEQLADRELVVPCGGTLGGGSSINLMTYSRAQRSDFDSWKTPGWSADELLPFLKKLETYHGPGAETTHGYDGPLHISRGTYGCSRAEDEFIKVAGKLGWPEIEDLMNLDNNNGVMRQMRYIDPDGRRQDVASRYLHPRLDDGKHPNLHVVVDSLVHRVLFDGKRASGVEYSPHPDVHPDSETRSIKARKLVVISSGALGTPLVLERSGVGDSQILRQAGVPLVADVPGVGHDYQDHHVIISPFKTNLGPEETIDAILTGRSDPGELIKQNNKILGWNAMDVTSKLRPNASEIAALGPHFEEAWKREFQDNPNKPLMMLSAANCFPGDPSVIPAGQYYSTTAFTPYPFSRGHVHITGPGVSDSIDFTTGFFTDPNDIDLKKHVWTYKKQREIVRRMDIYRGELALAHPEFPAGSKAACIDIEDSPPTDVQDIEYTAEDDAAIEKWLRQNVQTTWHSMGTCKMAPYEEKGVVDGKLDVYGVEGLKCADLSIAPQNVGANTMNTAVVIGEKAADIFIQELSLGAK